VDWETFTVLWKTDGTFSLQSAANGKYVAAVPNGESLIADRLEILPWEKFDLISDGSTLVW
jgi:hypothetical protein